MTRAPHIQPLPVWPTAPGISSAVRTAPLLLEEKGLGDEVDWPSEQRSVTECRPSSAPSPSTTPPTPSPPKSATSKPATRTSGRGIMMRG